MKTTNKLKFNNLFAIYQSYLENGDTLWSSKIRILKLDLPNNLSLILFNRNQNALLQYQLFYVTTEFSQSRRTIQQMVQWMIMLYLKKIFQRKNELTISSSYKIWKLLNNEGILLWRFFSWRFRTLPIVYAGNKVL